MRVSICLAGILLIAAPLRAHELSHMPRVATTLSPAGEGRRAWLKLNCYSCHGSAAGGGMGPNVQHAEAGDINDVMLHGGDFGMPSFAKYSTATDRANIAAYLQSIGGTNEPKFWDWWVPIPPK